MFDHIVSFFIEGGPVKMARPTDDTYYEAQVNGREEIRFTSLALGGGLRVSPFKGLQFEAGLRTLGEQHMRTDIIADETYFACAAAGTCKGIKPQQWWLSTGRESQAFGSAGYAFRLGGSGLSVVPSVGVAETRIEWHTDARYYSGGRWWLQAHTITAPRYFVGVTLQGSRFGLGLFYLDTAPQRSLAVDEEYAGQGDGALYLRATVRL